MSTEYSGILYFFENKNLMEAKYFGKIEDRTKCSTLPD
jgi:hypothetical protein